MLPRTLRSAASFDRTKIDVGFALRSTAGVAIALVAGLALGRPGLGAAAAVGALSAGFASQQGVYRTRAAAMLWTSAGMALSAFAGALTKHDAVATVSTIAVWGYAYGIIASLGPAATAAALNSTIALIVFGNVNVELTTGAAALQAACVFAGGAVQTVLLALVWPVARFTVERRVLSSAYHALAGYARTLCASYAAAPSPALIATVRSTLADPQPFAQRGDIAMFAALLDEAERIRGTLAALAAAGAASTESSPEAHAVTATGERAAKVLDAIADALRDGREPRADVALTAPLAAAPGEGDVRIAADASALGGQLRSALRMAAEPASAAGIAAPDVPSVPLFPTFADALQTLRANVHVGSPFGRLAVRLAVTLAAAATIYRAFDLRNGYWVALTAVLLLKPDYTTTMSRGVARVAGTLAGALVATAIAAWLDPSPHVDVALCVVFAAVGYVAFAANYAAYTVTITAYVIFMLALLGQPEHAAVAARVEATLGGAALAGVAMLVWPTWEAERVTERLAELIEAQRVYCRLLLDAYARGKPQDVAALRAAQSAAWSARAEAEASVDRAVGEPERTHALPPAVALGVLAASRRLGLALLALNVHQPRGVAVERPEIIPLSNAVDAALASYAESLRSGRPPPPSPPLRAAFETAQAALERAGDPARAFILPELDFIVDSVNTLGSLLEPGRLGAGPGPGLISTWRTTKM